MTEPEIVLSCSNGRWRATGLGLALEHRDLRGIDALLEAELGSRGIERVTVRFDTSSLPVALLQYHTHYFNYSLHLEKGDIPLFAASEPPVEVRRARKKRNVPFFEVQRGASS